MSFDGARIFTAPQHLGMETKASATISFEEAKSKFKKFIREWSSGNSFIYRDQLLANARKGEYYINIDLEDLNAFDDRLATDIRTKPSDFIPIFEKGLKELYKSLLPEVKEVLKTPDFQIQILSSEKPRMLRDIQSGLIGQLIVVPGIITAAGRPLVKSKKITIRCRECGEEKPHSFPLGMGGNSIPRFCSKSSCPPESYEIVEEKCKFINVQTMRLQENPEQIPTGEIPRSYQVYADRYLVDKVHAGSRVKIVGVLSVQNKKDSQRAAKGAQDSKTKQAYIRAIGIQREQATGGKIESLLSAEDEGNILKLAKDPKIREKIASSIASAIFGSDDIKEAISCLLFGGSPKLLPDKTRLRGDINVLLLGDPSTAKSQFLKFVERCAPIAVYTSGKGSSAAGLTATIVKDAATGEFQLEGGAMVLADGGVVCIDEFDKMRVQDRVAIHEAMEQQTISVAKAGITTVLNSRAAVLAAANPVFGRYDDLREASEQVEFQSTILSRFDCIFLVRDIRGDVIDRQIAEHVIGLHMGTIGAEEVQGEIPLEVLKKYILYARSKCFPRLTEESGAALENFYVEDRQQAQSSSKKEGKGIPITVRQLEAIIRLSESFAKMELSSVVNEKHVQEAHRIFKISTMNAATSGFTPNMQIPEEIREVILKIEEAIRKRMGIGTKMSYQALQDDMATRFGEPRAVAMALRNMSERDEINYKDARKIVYRKK